MVHVLKEHIMGIGFDLPIKPKEVYKSPKITIELQPCPYCVTKLSGLIFTTIYEISPGIFYFTINVQEKHPIISFCSGTDERGSYEGVCISILDEKTDSYSEGSMVVFRGLPTCLHSQISTRYGLTGMFISLDMLDKQTKMNPLAQEKFI